METYTLADFLDWLFADAHEVAGAAGFSAYAETHALDHALGKTAWTMPTTVALALCTIVPTVTSTGATITEGTYTGYARQTIAAAGWNAASGSAPATSTNVGTITFPACTGNPVTVIGWALLDSATTGAGNSLVWGTCASVSISTTQTPPTLAASALSITLT